MNTKIKQATVYELYQQGMVAKEIERQTGYEKEYIEDKIWRWEVIKAREKKKHEDEQYLTRTIPNLMYKKPESGFILLTDNQQVINAYNKLIKP